MPKKQLFSLGVKALIQNSDRKLLLLRGHEADYWDFPGGGVMQGEGAEDALRREIIEEIGDRQIMGVKPWKLCMTPLFVKSFLPEKIGLIFEYYLCDVDLVLPILLSSEHASYEWHSWAEAQALLNIRGIPLPDWDKN